MANTFGIGFAVGATLSPSVANAFSTVEQKIKATSRRLEALQKKSRAAGEADALRQRTLELQRRYAAGGGKDALLGAALGKTVAQYRVAQAEAAKYGLKVGEYARAHAKASEEIVRTGAALNRYARQKVGADKRGGLRGRLMDTVGPALAVAAPVKWGIDSESSMADAAKTIDGMRDSAGNLTPEYYEMETAVKSMGRTLPLAHTELAALFAAGGQQGMTAVEDLKEFATMAAHMSVAFGMSTEEAADAIGGYRSAMHLSMPEARSMLDLMNQFANTTSASEKGIKESLGAITPLLDSLDQVKKNLIIAGDESQYAGAMQKEFENRSRTTANALILMSNRIKEAGITIRSVLLPPLNSLLNVVGPLVSGVAEFAQKHQGLTTLVVGAAAGLIGFRIAAIGAAYASTLMGGGLLNIAKIMGVFVPGLATATTAGQVLSLGIRGIGLALRFAFGPVGLLISAAALGFGYLWEKCAWFRDGFSALWEGLTSGPGELAEAFTGALGELGESIGQFFENIPGFSQISGFFIDAWSGLKNAVGIDDEDKEKIDVKPAAIQAQEKQRSLETPDGARPEAASGASSLQGADRAAAPAASRGGPGGLNTGPGGGLTVNMPVTLSGITDAGFARRLLEALRAHKGDFEKLISEIVHDQERLAYD